MIKKIPDPNKAQKDFLNIMKDYCEITEKCDHKELHEEIGINLVKQIKTEVLDELASCQSEQNLFVIAVLDFAEKILCSSDMDNTLFSDLHKIIAGTIDADRLDYCSRDAYCCGVRYDIFHYKRLLPNYRLIYKDNSFLFCPALKNMPEIEDLLKRRWDIFSNINFHHRVHKHEIIFSEILAKVGFEELQKIDVIHDLEQGESLPLRLESVWAIVKSLQSNNSLIDYSIIQLDDGWIDTLLKHAFFEKYKVDFRNEDKFVDDAEWNMFDELISAKKHYLSAFKRSVDFISFDKNFACKWIKHIEQTGVLLKADQTVKQIYSLVKKNLCENERKSEWTFLNYNLIISAIFPRSTNNFCQEVETKMNDHLMKKEGLGIVNCMLRPIDFSAGFSVTSMVLLWDINNNCQNFVSLSALKRKMEIDQNLRMPFHLYYLPKQGEAIESSKINDLLMDIIIEISDKYIQINA